MALPMLVGGAECGPSTPLQGLSKAFHQDRGIQQDFYGAGQRGLSKDVFRTQPENVSRDQDSARFFDSGAQSPFASKLAADAAIYDLSAMHSTLPDPTLQVPQLSKSLAPWASDFMQQSPLPMTEQALLINSNVTLEADALTQHAPVVTPNNLSWAPSATNFRMNSMPTFLPQVPQLERPIIGTQNISWEKEFQAQELQLTSEASLSQQVKEQIKPQPLHDADELSLTAGLLLDNLKHEENPKFQNSQFMGLMKQFRDREVVVDGNKIVENDGRTRNVDAKGKARAVVQVPRSSLPGVVPVFSSTMQQEGNTVALRQQSSDLDLRTEEQEDPNVAYFQRENEDFINYWNATPVPPATESKDARFWDKLQGDWDEFEAAAGIKPVEVYQFQPNNPYLLGDSSRTRHHLKHQDHSFASESILELEAAVQRNETDSRAWYELGVKQQENEREHKALEALQRAVDLDPTYLSAWLALAVSHANNNNREGALEAIAFWVNQNIEYKGAVEKFHGSYPPNPKNTLSQQYSQLIQCLISLATSDTSGRIDADIQIALGVLLNTNEEYGKAQDCFRTALAVRPDDWLLYNRVGATMANSGRANQALEYYYQALELNPGYIRARFNLGISYINLRRYEEAAQHILDALVLQENDGSEDIASNKRGVASTVLWDTLRTTSLHLQRSDLTAFCDSRDLEGFRNNFM